MMATFKDKLISWIYGPSELDFQPAAQTKSFLLALPQEIRDDIWRLSIDEVAFPRMKWSSVGAFGIKPRQLEKVKGRRLPLETSLLRSCRQILREVTPLLYRDIYLHLAHVDQIVPWLQSIGPRNSASVVNLVVSTGMTANDRWKGEPAWHAAFACMPNLQSITFDSIAYHTPLTCKDSHEDVAPRDLIALREIAQSAAAWSHVMSLDGRRNRTTFRYLPDSSPVTEWNSPTYSTAFVAVDEGLPEFLCMQLAIVLKRTVRGTLGFLMTGIPDDFFVSRGFDISFACAFTEMHQHARLFITYQKRPEISSAFEARELERLLGGLSLLNYLRIAGRHLDSTSALRVPSLFSQLTTLDVAFTDTDPERVVAGLARIEERCSKLFSLSIDLSPLHDRQPWDNAKVRFFDRQHVDPEMAQKWQPFWTKLDQMSVGRGRAHEGETPGYRRS